MALVEQYLTHCGSPPQRSHWIISLPWVVIAEKGQTTAHNLQPIQRSSSRVTVPSFFVIAFCGQAVTQGAS